MKLGHEIRWPRFKPFLRIVPEMPTHRLFVTWWTLAVAFAIFTLPIFPLFVRLLFVGGSASSAIIGAFNKEVLFKLFPASGRGASNYLVTIIISEKTLKDEPWKLQQEIFECRYWMTWLRILLYLPAKWFRPAYLCDVECLSRAHQLLFMWNSQGLERSIADVYEEARPMWQHYPYFRKAGWSILDIYDRINEHIAKSDRAFRGSPIKLMAEIPENE